MRLLGKELNNLGGGLRDEFISGCDRVSDDLVRDHPLAGGPTKAAADLHWKIFCSIPEGVNTSLTIFF